MFDRKALLGVIPLLTVATPVLAQDSPPTAAPEEVIQEPMPHSKASRTQASERSTTPAGKKAAKATHHVTLSINPAILLLGGIGAELEGAVGANVSLFASPSVLLFPSPLLWSETTNVSVSGFGIDGGLRFFPGGSAPKGFWFGPYGGFAVASATSGRNHSEARARTVGGMLGYSWIFKSNFYFSLGAGGGLQSVTGAYNITTTRPAPALRFALGFAP
jgi:hypothetical protein